MKKVDIEATIDGIRQLMLKQGQREDASDEHYNVFAIEAACANMRWALNVSQSGSEIEVFTTMSVAASIIANPLGNLINNVDAPEEIKRLMIETFVRNVSTQLASIVFGHNPGDGIDKVSGIIVTKDVGDA